MLRPLNINPHSFVHLFSLLLEPRVVLFSVYGEPKTSGALLVGPELQNDIIRFERKAIPYRTQITCISEWLHRE